MRTCAEHMIVVAAVVIATAMSIAVSRCEMSVAFAVVVVFRVIIGVFHCGEVSIANSCRTPRMNDSPTAASDVSSASARETGDSSSLKAAMTECDTRSASS